MTKPPLLATSAVLLTLCAPALAQPSQPSPAVQPLSVKLTVKAGADTRVHELAIFDHGCGRVEDKAGTYEDDINVCTRPAPSGVHVEVSWKTRNGPTEYRTTSATVMARKNSKFEVGRSGGTRFTLQLL